MTPKHVTLNDFESPFYVKFCFVFCAGVFGALKPGFQSLATLKLVKSANFKPKRRAAASRGLGLPDFQSRNTGDFYRAMHVVQRGIAIVCRPFVRLSVCLSVCNVDVR